MVDGIVFRGDFERPGVIRTAACVLLFALAFLAFGNDRAEARATAGNVPPTYEVQAGDTLWGIGEQVGISAYDLAACAGVSDPDHIVAGQVLPLAQCGGAGHAVDPPDAALSQGPLPAAEPEPVRPKKAARATGPAAAAPAGVTAADAASKYLGTPYVLGGPESCAPYEAMDCTCLISTAFADIGVPGLPDGPDALEGYLAANAQPVYGPPRRGDIVLWPGYHAAIAEGDGTVIHASSYEGVVVSGTPIDDIGAPYSVWRLV